jgi:hypothetical protein
MAAGEVNPYESPKPSDRASRGSIVGRAVAIAGFVAAAAPSILVLFWLYQDYLVLYGSPTTSYRPLLAVYGFGLSILTVFVVAPFPFLAGSLGGKSNADLAMYSFSFIPFPFALGLFGPLVVSWATGSSFGS